jgi:hypothetical protein
VSDQVIYHSIQVSGIRVLSFARYTRRDRFILAAALSFGLGDLLVPGIFIHLFDGVNNPNSALQGFFNSITIILSTPCELLKPSFPSNSNPDGAIYSPGGSTRCCDPERNPTQGWI